MGKRSRRPSSPKQRAALPAPPPGDGLRPAGDPDRLLLDALADGELDHSLHALADGELDHSLHALAEAISACRHLLHTVKAATALAQLCVGDQVRINHTVSPEYLHGACGRVIDLDEHTAIALLDITINADQPASRLLAAYRHWTGAAT